MITVIPTGGANLNSLTSSLQRINLPFQLSQDPKVIEQSPLVLLPGVGHAGKVMQTIEDTGLAPVIKNLQQPVIGICIGLQILFDFLEEGQRPGLGILPGPVKKFETSPDFPVPHMGWNEVEFDSELGDLSLDSKHFYFVHSFFAPHGPWVKGVCQEAGRTIPALVKKENFWGIQFHPERSGPTGDQFLDQFLRRHL